MNKPKRQVSIWQKFLCLFLMSIGVALFSSADSAYPLRAQTPEFSVRVQKTIDWSNQDPIPLSAPFEICIYEAAEPCQNFTDGQTQTWSGLSANTYAIVETDPGGLWQVTAPSPVNATTTLPVPNNGFTYRRQVVNKYIGGKLQVNMAVDWNSYPSVLGQQFNVCINGPAGAAIQRCELLNPEQTHTWEGLVSGDYQVSESPGAPWLAAISPSTVYVPELDIGTTTIKNRVRSANLNLVKQATPSTIAPGQTVTYDFFLSHNGDSEVYVTSPFLTDERCTPAPRQSGTFNVGDNNTNNRLDLAETWEFSCSSVVNEDTTDSAIATALHPLGSEVSSNRTATTVDVLPVVQLTKKVEPGTLPEPGGTFIYTLDIQNGSQDAVTIVKLVDDFPLSAACTNLVGQILAPGDVANCSYGISHSTPGEYLNSATVAVADDDGNEATSSDSATATVTDAPASLSLAKVASTDVVSESGALVDFTLTIQNTSLADAITLTEIGDSIYGDTTFVGSVVTASDCAVGQLLGPGDTYICTFSGFVSGNIGDIHTNFVTVKGLDSVGQLVQQSDSATIVVVDSNPALSVTNDPETTSIPEPGGPVRFDVTVTNSSVADTITIQALEGSAFGDLTTTVADDPGSLIAETTCVTGASLAVGQVYSCSFVASILGEVGDVLENTVVAIGTISNGNSTSAFSLAEIEIVDVPAALAATKTASKPSVLESGEEVVFTASALNASTLDSIRIDAVVDDVFGNIGSGCLPALPTMLPPGAAVSCVFTETVAGNVATPHMNTITFSGFDDDDNSVSAQASAQIDFEDVPSRIQVIKKADQPTASRSGDPIVFDIRVANLSDTDTVAIERIEDSIYGNVANLIAGDNSNIELLSSDCAVPQSLAAGKLYECRFEAMVSGGLNDEHRNVVTIFGTDDDALPVSASDDAVVLIADPVVSAVKAAQIISAESSSPEPTIATPGDTIRYTVVLNNAGNATAEAVLFNDIPDDNTILIADSVHTTVGEIAEGNDEGDTKVVIRIDELPAGNSATITFDVKIADTLSEEVVKISNQGLITGDNFPSISTENSKGNGPTETFIQATPVLAASKTAALAIDSNGDGNFSPGDQILYEVVIRNTGSATATNVQLNDLIDINATLVSGSVSTTLGDVTLGNNSADSAVMIEIPALERGQTASVRYTVRIKSPLPQSITQIVNQASISSDQTSTLSDDPDVEGAQDPTIIGLRGVARIDASKVALLLIDEGDSGFSAGDTMIYQITVRNSGSVSTGDVIFEDILDPNTTLDTGSVQTDQGSVAIGNGDGDTSVRINIGELQGDSVVKISFRAEIDADILPELVSVRNQGVVKGVGFADALTDDPNISGRLDSTDTVLRPTAILKLSVTDIFLIDADGDNLVTAGDTILYQLSLSNVGRNVARQILVEDTPDPYMSLVAESVNVEMGTVEKGNSSADGVVLIAIDRLAEGETTMMSFQAKILKTPPSGFLRNQAQVRFMNSDSNQVGGQQIEVQSDDPSTSESDDATLTPMGRPLTEGLFLPVVQ